MVKKDDLPPISLLIVMHILALLTIFVQISIYQEFGLFIYIFIFFILGSVGLFVGPAIALLPVIALYWDYQWFIFKKKKTKRKINK